MPSYPQPNRGALRWVDIHAQVNMPIGMLTWKSYLLAFHGLIPIFCHWHQTIHLKIVYEMPYMENEGIK